MEGTDDGAVTEPTTAPATGGNEQASTSKKRYRRTCVCNTESCRIAMRRFKASLPPDHPFNKGDGLTSLITDPSKPPDPLMVALKLCLALHWHLLDSLFQVNRWYVALWHWPILLLDGPNKIAFRKNPFVSKEEAEAADVLYLQRDNSFSQDVNNVHTLLTKAKAKYGNVIPATKEDGNDFCLPVGWKGFDDCYVQAPINPFSDVILEVLPYENQRHRRTTPALDIALPSRKRRRTSSSWVDPDTEDTGADTFMHPDGSPYTQEEIDDLDKAARNASVSFSLPVTMRACLQICESHGFDEAKLRDDDTFQMLLNNLYYNWRVTTVPVSDNRTLYLCPCFDNERDSCRRFVICYESSCPDSTDGPKCAHCTAEQYKANRTAVRQNQSIAQGVDRTSHDSSVPYSCLSREELVLRLRSHAKLKRALMAKLQRLRNRCNKETLLVRPSETEFISLLEKVFSTCLTNNGKDFRQIVVRTLIQSVVLRNGGYKMDETELKGIDDYATRTLAMFENYASRIRQPKSVRYSPEVIRQALAFWLRSPTNYEELRRHSLEIYPSARTLYRYQSKLISHEGFCPMLYAWAKEQHKLHGRKVDAIICFDEMTFESDIYSNVKNNITYGFAASDGVGIGKIDLATELYRYFNESEGQGVPRDEYDCDELSFPDIEEDFDSYRCVPAKKVNLLRLRTMDGHASNLEYWYNSGSLTGDQTLAQLLQAIFQCELLDIRIHMICADAGSGNKALFGLLRESKLVEGVLWPEDGSCSFRNPAAPERRVAVIPCTVHGLKAMRNALLNSQLGQARGFTLMNVFFGWMQKRKVLDADVPASARHSSLNMANINPDSHSKMNVCHAMAPFTYKTLIFECMQFAKSLPDYTGWDLILAERKLKRTESTTGYESEKLLEILAVLKGLPQVQNGLDPEKQAALNCLEYSIHVHGIYVSRFLNSKACVVREFLPGQSRVGNPNDQEIYVLEEEIEKFKLHLAFFDNWYQETQGRHERDEPGWQRSFLAPETYLNMRQSIWGFFAFARYVLEIDDDSSGGKRYWNVPYLLANQSTVEHIFSVVREANRNNSYTFPKAMLACALMTKPSYVSMDRGKSYDSALLRYSESPNNGGSVLAERRDMQRCALFSQWQGIYKQRGTAGDVSSLESSAGGETVAEATTTTAETAVEPSTTTATPPATARTFWTQLLCKPENGISHFDALMEMPAFHDIAKMSMFESSQTFFETIYTKLTSDDRRALEDFCSQFVSKLVECLVSCNPKQKPQMGTCLYTYFQSEEFTQSIHSMPSAPLRSRCALGLIAICLFHHIVGRVHSTLKDKFTLKLKKWLGLQEVDALLSGVTTSKPPELMLNRFVGYGIYRLIDKAKSDKTKEADEKSLSFYKSIRIFDAQAMLMPDYCVKYYDECVALANHGYLAMVAPEYIPFALLLMRTLMNVITEKELELYGQNALIIFKDAVAAARLELLETFEECSVSAGVESTEITGAAKVFAVDYITEKALHSYFGGVLKAVKEKRTKKGGSNHVGSALRKKMKILEEEKASKTLPAKGKKTLTKRNTTNPSTSTKSAPSRTKKGTTATAPSEPTTVTAPSEPTTVTAPSRATTRARKSAPSRDKKGTTATAPKKGTTVTAPRKGTTVNAPSEATTVTAPLGASTRAPRKKKAVVRIDL